MDVVCSPPTQASEQRAERPRVPPPSGFGPAPQMDVVCSPPTQASEQRAERPRVPPPSGFGPAPQMDVVCSPPTQASEQRAERPRVPPPSGFGPAPQMDVVCSPPTQASEQRAERPCVPPPSGFGPAPQMDVVCSPPTQASGSDHQIGKNPSLASCTAPWIDKQNQSLPTFQHLDPDYLRVLLKQSKYNWFELVELLENQFQGDISGEAETVFSQVSKLGLDTKAFHVTEQSYFAYRAIEKELYEDDHTARALNGEIVSDIESDDPNSYIGVTDPFSAAGKDLVKKKRVAIHRRAKRKQAKAVAERRILARKLSKKTSKILKECPDIGKEIETFVQSHNVGADAWRRTGVLTFDGNLHVKEKVTYERIRKYLEEVYKRKISYGTVIQMCVPRNKRRRSAKNYRGIAKVTSRRARKGFNLKFNPDAHWSATFYKALNGLQYKDGRDILNINRDDATGFRLDTLTTCKQYRSPVLHGKDILTTRSDYVNKYPSVLQTTSYNFSGTATTEEVCVGIIKAPKIHQKNPAQHATDIEFLENTQQLQSVFVNAITGRPKSIECIRVDGAADEGPAHEEVQFWWTARHISKSRQVTLVTTRSSGSSYLNRVELQNGCLSLGHANTFIPSTLTGSCEDPLTGAIDDEKLRKNLDLAMDVYISRVNG